MDRKDLEQNISSKAEHGKSLDQSSVEVYETELVTFLRLIWKLLEIKMVCGFRC